MKEIINNLPLIICKLGDGIFMKKYGEKGGKHMKYHEDEEIG